MGKSSFVGRRSVWIVGKMEDGVEGWKIECMGVGVCGDGVQGGLVKGVAVVMVECLERMSRVNRDRMYTPRSCLCDGYGAYVQMEISVV